MHLQNKFWIDLSSYGLEAYLTGHGPLLILLHGNYSNYHYFNHLISKASLNYQVLAINAQGHGGSGIGDKKLSYKLLAEDILNVLHILKLAPYAIIGFSDGGIVALHALTLKPNLCQKLVLIGTNYRRSGVHLRENLRTQGLVNSLWHLSQFVPLIKKPYDILALMTDPIGLSSQSLRLIKQEVLILSSQNDLIKNSHSQEIHKLIPKSKLAILNDGGHHILHQKTEEVFKLMNFF